MEIYKLAACGGTFDLFHKGHKEFLQFVLQNTKKAIIGITSDLYTEQFKSSVAIAPYVERKQAVEEYLTNINELERVIIVPIDDAYGPTATDEYPIEALIVTDDTKKGAEKINQVRTTKNLSVLPIVSTELVIGEDGGIISSQRIRDGIINREGRLFIYDAWFAQTFLLPEALRGELQKPMGELIPNFEEFLKRTKLNYSTTATVGDIVTSRVNSFNLKQRLSIFDFLVERQEKYHSYKELGFNLAESEILTLDNPAGSISGKAFELLKTVLLDNTKAEIMVKVNGEEDLLVLPLILAAPLSFTCFYGQPKEGVVQLTVTEELKERIFALLSQFERKA